MTGQILEYSIQTNSGIISGDDGQRYSFTGAEWRDASNPVKGMRVDFEPQENNATAIYRVLSSSGLAGDKNKLVAGLLAIFLGAFGVHKFYLGFKKPGIIMAVAGGAGFLLSFVLIGLPILLAVSAVAFVEGVLYLTKSDEEFEQIYVVGKKQWF